MLETKEEGRGSNCRATHRGDEVRVDCRPKRQTLIREAALHCSCLTMLKKRLVPFLHHGSCS